MKRIPGLMLLGILCTCELAAQLNPDYENPAVFQRNQTAPHATLVPYGSMDRALEADRSTSSSYRSLNGSWLFHWSENPDQAPADFYTPGFDRSGWERISVPSNWQMEGFGTPLFRNIGLPHPLDPPEVPRKFNPVGSYYRTFTLPEEWDERQVLLHFEGVQSASYVWINGIEAGYNQGGMEPAEYDITPYLNKGENSIAVKVLRYSDGSYMEDQDTWRLSGIYRDVYLMAAPRIHIRDFYITTDLDERYRDATLNVVTSVTSYLPGNHEGYSVRVTLFDAERRAVPGGSSLMRVAPLEEGSETAVSHQMEISDPLKWSAEYPNLYTVVMELLDESDRTLELLSSRVGFREVEVIDQAVCVNGVPVKFNGVNSHMLHPETGHAMDVETMRKDLYLMKQFNINCVRTSHYPPNVAYLELADELGIYIVDETGDEAHAYTAISYLPEWREQYLDRMRKMVYRDRNHPSVVFWSAGNESGPGDNLCAIMEEGKRIDPSRPGFMYGGNRDTDPGTNPIKCEDIVGPRYLQPFILEHRFGKSDDPRPSFMDEYIAATGNSLGGLDEYWEEIYSYRRLTGGAIWDWISPGISMEAVATPDESPGNIQCVLINKAHFVPGAFGSALYLSGNDDWLEVARDPSLDISGNGLSLSFWVRPEEYNGNAAYLTKGDYQFGIIQPDSLHLQFYLNTRNRRVVQGALPETWIHNWHHVAGVYDGSQMTLYVDGEAIGTRECRGEILNSPYAVVLGKSAELRDSHRGYTCHATLDRVRIFDRPVPVEELMEDQTVPAEGSLLWLDFEAEEEIGSYYSIGLPGRTYGLVWPDRTIQPELWQLKKTPQPVHFSSEDPGEGVFEVVNRYHFRDLSELDIRWELTSDGEVIQQGVLELELPAGERREVKIPFRQPVAEPGSIYYLLISCRTTADQPWAEAGHEVAWDQFRMPWYTPLSVEPVYSPAPLLQKGEKELVIRGDGFTYTFDTESGSLNSMVVGGTERLLRGPRFNVWRAPLANDLDSWNFWQTEMGYTTDWMGRETANGWRSTGIDRLVQELEELTTASYEERVEILVRTSLHANNYTTGYRVSYLYTVMGDGTMDITTDVSPEGYQPRWLPKAGLQLELPGDYNYFSWFGRGPYENYPDRKTGARVGVYRTNVEDDYVPYIIPQDYGNRCDLHWLSVTDEHGNGFLVTGTETFNASVQKYSTGNLDRAHYPFQLREEQVVTLNLDHRVSGVGGTANSVLDPYRVLPETFHFKFHLKPLKP